MSKPIEGIIRNFKYAGTSRTEDNPVGSLVVNMTVDATEDNILAVRRLEGVPILLQALDKDLEFGDKKGKDMLLKTDSFIAVMFVAAIIIALYLIFATGCAVTIAIGANELQTDLQADQQASLDLPHLNFTVGSVDLRRPDKEDGFGD